MKLFKGFVYLSFLFLSFYSQSDMLNFLKPHSYKICPDINGVVHKVGEAYPNLKITLDVAYEGSHFTYDAITDKNGHFHFKEVTLHRWTRPSVLNNNLMGIWLHTKINGVDKNLWVSYSETLVPDKYIVDNLSGLECDIDGNEYLYHFENEQEGAIPYSVMGICNLKGHIEKFDGEEN
ncbi:DUF6795 domain-containing protein [Photobacterium nomapromontoriensis]|uniref:DUF6795 domain-containing protein n=1 Tax=Photobacterium nomapromontoriensis TaxID=2910237 RepID=UPI003D0F2968